MSWKYDPSMRQIQKSPKLLKNYTLREYLDKYGKNFHGYCEKGWDLEKCLKDFFDDPKIQELLSDNDWEEIFNYWTPHYKNHPGNHANWTAGVLARFLWLANINFWDYLPKESGAAYEIGDTEWEDK